MSDRGGGKRPRFGDAPVRPGTARGGGGGGGDDDDNAATRVGAPLPLVTQPMMAVSPPPGTGAGGMSPRQLAHTVPHDRVQVEPRAPTPAIPAMEDRAMVPVGARELAPHLAARQPPEIGLTQHHLPDDAPPDGRLVLINEPDSERAASFRVL